MNSLWTKFGDAMLYGTEETNLITKSDCKSNVWLSSSLPDQCVDKIWQAYVVW
jgi:hypothetical protein